ncbi:11230_t:CDS:2 [Entrophospora sp. SA101]|nr:6309_t:CDS:2 [Entrophospora sp. SA101]CAJ0646885.1 11230_t:CDS:2 [Entrophospora sp. SA101]CAJ0911726.1 2213_t:CDS:2 [Entrophospora sp. SA101]CAJ0920572.1 9491_t:CDS:2 [Entrophospora sp. SA101]
MNMEKKLFQEQQTIASAGFKIIETNEDAITETEGVIGYAAQKDKEIYLLHIFDLIGDDNHHLLILKRTRKVPMK